MGGRIKAEPCPCCGHEPVVSEIDCMVEVYCRYFGRGGCVRGTMWRGLSREAVVAAWNEQIKEEKEKGLWNTYG